MKIGKNGYLGLIKIQDFFSVLGGKCLEDLIKNNKLKLSIPLNFD